jgi:hypothetical protein
MYSPEVALESIFATAQNSFSQMVGNIREYFPSLKNGLQGTIDHLTNLKEVPKDIANILNNNFLTSEQKQLNLQDFKKVKIQIPEGFSGNLYDYAGFLDRSWDFIHLKGILQLDVLYAQLASFASNKESKISLIDNSKDFMVTDAALKELIKESTTYFGGRRHTSSSSELGIHFMDFSQVEQTNAAAVKLAKQQSSTLTKDLLDKAKRIASVLDIIIGDAQNHDTDKASHEAVKSLAAAVYTMAEVLEFYSVTCYRVTELCFVMKENKTVIAKIV